jgi:LemA protein
MLPLLLVALILLALATVVMGYNQLVRGRNQVREAWSGIDVQLRRRASLIPNLVGVVQRYALHEQATFEEVARARGALQKATGAREAADANSALSTALGRLFAVVERYPQLRASENFTKLQDDLSDIEAKIAFARQFYNRNVLDYNNQIDVFPTVVIANSFNFKSAEFFDAGNEGRMEVRVAFTSPGVAPEPTAPPPATR